MGQWQYKSATILLEDNQYVLTLLDGRKLWGIDIIMNYWASYGWELVSLVPIQSVYNYHLVETPTYDVIRLIAVFKRWQETPQPGGGSAGPRISGPLTAPQE